jgi:hypothetical protein
MSNDEFQDALLEQRLKKLRPVPLTKQQTDRLLEALPAPHRRAVPLRVWWTLAAAAVVLISVTIPGVLTSPAPVPEKAVAAVAAASVPNLQFLAATNQVVETRHEGTCQGSNGQPYEVLRCLSLKRSLWRNPKDGQDVEVVWPEQRVLLVAANTL